MRINSKITIMCLINIYSVMYNISPRFSSSMMEAVKARCAVMFSDQRGNIAKFLIRKINESTRGSSIHVASYHLTDPLFAHALVAARRRGVKVCAYVDGSSVKESRDSVSLLKRSRVPVQVYRSPSGSMHYKAIVLGRLVCIGSYNLSQKARADNEEVMLFAQSAPIANFFRKQMKLLTEKIRQQAKSEKIRDEFFEASVKKSRAEFKRMSQEKKSFFG